MNKKTKREFCLTINQVVDGYYTLCLRNGLIWKHHTFKLDVDIKKINKIIKEINSLME